jgi:hypothetical protein
MDMAMTFEALDEIPTGAPVPEPTGASALERAFNQGANLTGLDVADEPVIARKRGRPRGSTSARRAANVAGAKQIGDLFITGLILLVSFTIGEWANPTPEESDAIARPLGNILARRIDLAAKLGKDADDVVALVIAMALWMSRIGPVAVERAKSAVEERRNRATANRVERPPEPVNARRAAGVDAGDYDPTSASDVASRNPLDAIAEVSRNAARGFGRNAAANPA